jgi:hypothetical protein
MSEYMGSNELKIRIEKELLEPSYYDEVKTIIRNKEYWHNTGKVFEVISKLLISSGCVLSFSSGYYQNPTLSFISGSISTCSLAMIQFSTFCYKEEQKNRAYMSKILNKFNIRSYDAVTEQTVDSIELSVNGENNENKNKQDKNKQDKNKEDKNKEERKDI